MNVRILFAVICLAALGCDKAAPSNQAQQAEPAATADPYVLRPAPSKEVRTWEPEGEQIIAELTPPPFVPPPTNRTKPAHVKIELEVIEKTMPISPGVDYVFWTFGGTVPGSFIRIRQGDTVEFHLKNHPDSKMPHNIDLHSVTGPGGGAASTFTAPGHGSSFTFKALNAGLFVYHCATAPVGMHVANGMYGLILVEPPEGLPPVDREYYVMQGDFYTVGKYREEGEQPFDMQKAIEENATYVVFNGSEESLLGENSLKAKVGERVRLYVGNGGPNLVSSFHVIGEIFDRIYREGGTQPESNIQTTLVPAGGATIAEFDVDVPGSYVLVDHSLFRAFNKGALGMLDVTGDENEQIFTGKQIDYVYLGDKAPEEPSGDVLTKARTAGATLEDRIEAGKMLYAGTCSVCHQPNGAGLPKVFPPLAASDYFNEDKARTIGVVLNGMTGPVTVNGETFNSVMPPMSQLNDDEVANILTYVAHNWGNKKVEYSPEEVAHVRATTERTSGAAH